MEPKYPPIAMMPAITISQKNSVGELCASVSDLKKGVIVSAIAKAMHWI